MSQRPYLVLSTTHQDPCHSKQLLASALNPQLQVSSLSLSSVLLEGPLTLSIRIPFHFTEENVNIPSDIISFYSCLSISPIPHVTVQGMLVSESSRL